MFWYDWTMIILIPGIIVAAWAQDAEKLQSNFHKYSRVFFPAGLYGSPGCQRYFGCERSEQTVAIERTRGNLPIIMIPPVKYYGYQILSTIAPQSLR